jgi:LytS/YehU family sensor histidine kinase
MNDSGIFAMDSLFNAIRVLVTAAFVLTFVPGLTLGKRSSLSMRDRGRALLGFMVLGLVEAASVSRSAWSNERIVAVCVAGLLAGPRIGVAVSGFVTWLTVKYDGSPPAEAVQLALTRIRYQVNFDPKRSPLTQSK